MVINVPPASDPNVGVILSIIGSAKYVNPPGRIPVPPIAVTLTFLAPGSPAGISAISDNPSLATETMIQALTPIVTAVTLIKSVPEIVTVISPATELLFGDMLLTTGAATYVNPPGRTPTLVDVITATSCGPATPTGVVAKILVEFTTSTFVHEILLIVTPVTSIKALPRITTAVPPEAAPIDGDMLVIMRVDICVVNGNPTLTFSLASIKASTVTKYRPSKAGCPSKLVIETTVLVAGAAKTPLSKTGFVVPST